MLYFFYSQNLSLCEIGQLDLSRLELMGKVKLLDYKLTFRFFANVEPDPGNFVEGFLFWINPEHQKLIDDYEMFPKLYTKREKVFNSESGPDTIRGKVFMQKFTKQLPLQPPHPDYLANLYKLYMETGLPLDQINNALGELKN